MDTLEHYHMIQDRIITYNIPADRLSLNSFYGVYFVSVLFKNEDLNGECPDNTTIIFNDAMLYGFRWYLITRTCIPCRDQSNYEKLQLLQLSEQMFRDSVKLGRIDEAIGWFDDILRIMKDHKQVFEDIDFKRCLDGSWKCHLNISLAGNDFPESVCNDDSCKI